MALVCLQDIRSEFHSAVDIFAQEHRGADLSFDQIAGARRSLRVKIDALGPDHDDRVAADRQPFEELTRDFALIGFDGADAVVIDLGDASGELIGRAYKVGYELALWLHVHFTRTALLD